MKRSRILINGDPWTVKVVSCEEFKAIRGHLGEEAVTMYNHSKGLREIIIRRKYLSLDTILHELIHAHLSYRDFSKLSYGQVEEQVCEALPKKFSRILSTARRIKRL